MKKIYKYSNVQNLYNNIGLNIKYFRKEIRMTQAELADLTNLSHEYVRKIESKHSNKSLSISALNNIAIALKVNIEDLIKPNIETINKDLF